MATMPPPSRAPGEPGDRRYLVALTEQRERLPDKQRRDRDVFEAGQRAEAAELDAAIDRCRAAIEKTERELQ